MPSEAKTKSSSHPSEYLALRWNGHALLILDQTRLPHEEVYIEAKTPEAVAVAIKTMQVRGAPAIGIAAAFALLLAAKQIDDPLQGKERLAKAAELLASTRPTARNLFWSLERMLDCIRDIAPESYPNVLEREALSIQREDYEACRAIGSFGAELISDGAAILTHCNAGALATAGWGTALGVIRSAHAQGKKIRVFADETRPQLQGSRLTAWELERENIPVTLISDGAAAYCMQQKMIDAVIVGADRIARNGDTANKVGTYPVALAANEHAVPFYVAAPLSTVDLSLASGEKIPIEERNEAEILNLAQKRVAAANVKAFNPAFDITPSKLIKAIICDKGILRPPFEISWPR